MPPALLALRSRFPNWQPQPAAELVSTGIAQLDALTGGLPRGSIAEICGPPSSGRTSLALAIAAAATGRREICAWVDTSDTFDPATAAAAGVELDQLLWIRCGGRPPAALAAADQVLHAGGFGLTVLDLGDLAPRLVRRIPLTSWFRFHRAVERTPAVLVVLAPEPCAGSCSSLSLDLKKPRAIWTGGPGPGRLLRGLVVEAHPRKPARGESARFEARAAG